MKRLIQAGAVGAVLLLSWPTFAIEEADATDKPKPEAEAKSSADRGVSGECTAIGGLADSTLDEFAVRGSGDVTFATANVLSSFIEISKKQSPKVLWWPAPRTMGVRITTSLPAEASSVKDYGNAQLLLRDGGLINGYFSLGANWRWFDESVYCGPDTKWIRRFDPSRVYLKNHKTIALNDRISPYLFNGFGGKMIRTDLIGDDDNNPTGRSKDSAGAFVAYLGVGADAPIRNLNEDFASPAGTFDAQIFGMMTYANKDILQTIYSDDTISTRRIYSVGAKLNILVTGAVAFSVEYVAPVGGAKNFVDSTTLLSLSYRSGKTSAKEPDTGSEAPIAAVNAGIIERDDGDSNEGDSLQPPADQDGVNAEGAIDADAET